MYRPKTVKYLIPINDMVDESSQTIQVVQIYGTDCARCALMRRWLKYAYALTRKEANAAIRAMGFDDLIPNEQPCVS